MSKKSVLMPKAERREAALVVALKLAKKIGARRVSIAMVAAAQKVTAPLLFHIFESREGLTKAILKAAKAQGVVLPEAAPTVREARAVSRVGKTKLKTPTKPVKKLAKPPALPAKKVAALLKPPIKPVVRQITPEQKAAKASKDKARRAVTSTAATTPAGKFASLPKPFEASVASVA